MKTLQDSVEVSFFFYFFSSVLMLDSIHGSVLEPHSTVAKMVNDNPMEKDVLSGKLAWRRRTAKGLGNKKQETRRRIMPTR